MNAPSAPLISQTTLYPWQQVCFQTLSRTNLFVVARRSGKTYLLAFIACLLLIKVPEPVGIAVCAPSLRKARELLFDLCRSLLQSPQMPHIEFRIADARITNTQTGGTIKFFALSSEHRGMIRGERVTVAIIDELDECDHSAFHASLIPATMGLPPNLQPHRMLLLSGTPGAGNSLLTQLYESYKPLSPALSHLIVPKDASQQSINASIASALAVTDQHKRTFQARQMAYILSPRTSHASHASQSPPSPDYRVYHVTARMAGVIPPQELREQQALMPPATYAREIEVDLDATSEDVMFPPSLIRSACTAPLSSEGHIAFPSPPDTAAFSTHRLVTDLTALDPHPTTASLDLGVSLKSSADPSVLFIRQHKQPLYLASLDFSGLSLKRIMQSLADILNRYSYTSATAPPTVLYIDQTGPGEFFVREALHPSSPLLTANIDVRPFRGSAQPHYSLKEVAANLRASSHMTAKQAMTLGYKFPDIYELKQELGAIRLKPNNQDDRILLESKKDIRSRIGRSTNNSDVITMTFADPEEVQQDSEFEDSEFENTSPDAPAYAPDQPDAYTKGQLTEAQPAA